MRCPKCNLPFFNFFNSCENCQFNGDSILLEELSHLEWLAEEDVIWSALGTASGERLQKNYYSRQKKIERELGLRPPLFVESEIPKAIFNLFLCQSLLKRLDEWLKAGELDKSSTQPFIEEIHQQIELIEARLDDQVPPPQPTSNRDQLRFVKSLFRTIDRLSELEAFVSSEREEAVRASVRAERTQLEIKLGLRPEPKPEPVISKPIAPNLSESDSSQADQKTPHKIDEISANKNQESPVPKPPLRERIWKGLLSERTLQGMLFLGIFLLFSAALSFVVWGWKDFSAPLRVAIPTSFTAFCFAIGWYVRTKTPMYRSGIALSAIAALLVPIDFYTVYVNFRFPPEAWPTFWLITSIVSLIVYVIATYLIRSRFFGYAVGTAAGSTVLALIEVGHQLFGLALDWRSAGLSVLALTLIIIGSRLSTSAKNQPQSAGRVFAISFGYLSLLTVGVIMPLTFGWRYIQRDGFDILHLVVAINWWMGCLIFGWGAISYRSRALGILAAGGLPVAVYLLQDYLIYQLGVSLAWHAFGWAWLVPIYFLAAKKLEGSSLAVVQHHQQTAIRSGTMLLAIAAVWPLVVLNNETWPAAGTHTVLALAVLLAAWLWRKPNLIYWASMFGFSAMTFTMTALNLEVAQLSVGWATLAISHLILALFFGTRVPANSFATPLVKAGYVIAALAILPPIFPTNKGLLTYALSNWIILTGWGARLTHQRQPGFEISDQTSKPVFHWLTTLALPVWLWVFCSNFNLPTVVLPLALALLAWLMLLFSHRLKKVDQVYQQPWYLVGLLASIIAPVVAFITVPTGFAPALTLLLSGLLYFVDAYLNHHSKALAAGGLVTVWGYILFLEKLALPDGAVNIAIAILIGIYLAIGFFIERKKLPSYTEQFFSPLYITSHFVTLYLLTRIYIPIFFDQVIFGSPWITEVGLWGAATQYLLAAIYGLRTMQTRRQGWGHATVWLFIFGSGFIAITVSTGNGIAAAGMALLAVILILSERGLNLSRQHPSLSRRKRAFFRFTWSLYRYPLLVAGWIISANTIALALFRNLWWLGGGQTQQLWAVVALLLITGLYALSARLFRRVIFVWLSAALIFVPWTILTHLGWLTPYRPTLPAYGLSWVVLAWLLALIAQLLITKKLSRYALPLRTVAHLLTPFSLLWAAVDVEISCLTVGLAIGFYGLAARQDHLKLPADSKRSKVVWRTKFVYPLVGLMPIWVVYLATWLVPSMRIEQYGLLLVLFSPLGLIFGQWLRRQARDHQAAPIYALPAYLVTYITLTIGSLLVIHEPALLALVILYASLMMIVSAWLFKQPGWLYLASILTPLSLALALQETNWPLNRFGWWLIGLASIYLILAWSLKRVQLHRYSQPPLEVGLILTMISLGPSSLDQTGALWGYAGATLLYTITAFWLRLPPFLFVACGLVWIPYVIFLQKTSLATDYYGLALFPASILALGIGTWLDWHFGSSKFFPWSKPEQWVKAIMVRLLEWWALPLYILGLSLAIVAPIFCGFQSSLIAMAFVLQMAIFGWATVRFRLTVWLIVAAFAGHLAVFFALDSIDWWQQANPAQAWLGFLPVVLLTLLLSFVLNRYGSRPDQTQTEYLRNWAQALYTLALFDIAIGQWISLNGTLPGIVVSLSHAILLGLIASIRLSRPLTYISMGVGLLAVGQWIAFRENPIETLPVAIAQLALVYSLSGYGITFMQNSSKFELKLADRVKLWALPLQHSGLLLSIGSLILTGWLGIDLVGWTIGAMLGLPFRHLVEVPIVHMAIGVFGLLGLLYIATAFTYRWLRLGYGAIAMLLLAWMLHVFYLQHWDTFRHLQWYALPAGLFLVGIAYLEWQQGNKNFARWLDYSATVLMLGSLFWQTLLFGWVFALLLGSESLAAFFWGSYRRLRRFLYAGMIGMILATVGQLLNSLQSINQWIVFGLVGLILICLAVVVERKMEEIKAWHEILETWE